jgi:hypothetical protein
VEALTNATLVPLIVATSYSLLFNICLPLTHHLLSLGVASSFSGNALWGLIQAVVSDLNTVIGVQCSPIAGGGSWYDPSTVLFSLY